MSDKKRTTVTTIETHEIWIIRKARPELSDVDVLTPAGLKVPGQIQPSRQRSDGTETSEPTKEEEP